jgi:hypothetical protein
MLLVDHNKTEPVEADVLLDQSVGTHDKLGRSSPHILQDVLSETLALAANEEPHVDRNGLQKIPQGTKVLFAQDFRRSHEGSLVSTLNGNEHRNEGDNGLATSDVTLKQAVHRAGRGHVVSDFSDHLLLSPRKLEG